jgi:hypothetical protein
MKGLLGCVRLGTVLAPFGCSACLELPSIQYETEEALIGTDFDVPLCPDDLDRIDRHIAFVEDMLDAQSNEKIEIYIYAGSPPRCHEGGYSCYDDRRKMIRTNWSDLEHEVVHAIVDRFAEPPPFWNEGIAVALDRNGTHHGVATVMQSIHVRDSLDLDYSTAGHFVRWLLDEYDPTHIRPILEGAAFEPMYGVPFANTAASYEAERPYAYPPWFPCDYPLLPWQDGVWRESLEITCDAKGGSTAEGGPFSVLRTVELEPGGYELDIHGGFGVRLLGCQIDAFEEAPPAPPAMFHGDVPNQVEFSQTHPGRLFESGSVHDIEITEPGLFKVIVMANEEWETVVVELRPLD